MIAGVEKGQSFLDEIARQSISEKNDGWLFPNSIDDLEWRHASAARDCIVQNYLYADVGILVAPGATGKTTVVMYEAVHVALGLPLWGLDVVRPGYVLIITAEDTREMLVARLRDICKEMGLSAEQMAVVRERVRISDVSGGSCKLTAVVDDVVRPNYLVDEVVRACRDNHPVLVVIDPAVSFGVGESRVNDAEQGLVEAARMIRAELNCCVRFVHHTGKQNAREKTLDQYSGRGGSAFADGARMVAVMQGGYSNSEWLKMTGYQLDAGEHGLVIARPKVSYAPPQDSIFVVRNGFCFTRIIPDQTGAYSDLDAINNQVWQLLTEELKNHRYHTSNTLEALARTANLKRQEIRDAVRLLRAAGRVDERERPNHGGRGGAAKYLHPVTFGSPANDGGANVEEAVCLAE